MTCDSKINFFNLLLPHLTGFQRVLTNRLNVTIMIIACFTCFTFSWYKSLVFWNHEPNNRYLQLQIFMSMCYTYHMSLACCCNEQFGWISYSVYTVRFPFHKCLLRFALHKKEGTERLHEIYSVSAEKIINDGVSYSENV